MSVDALTKTFRLIRSKDAGPFMLTIDLFCHDADAYRRLLDSGVIDAPLFAELYGVDASSVEIHRVDTLNAMKISFPRRIASGELADGDITGGQEYGPLVARLATTSLGD